MYAYDEIERINIEPTTRCNAACPMCARNACGQTAPGLDLTELTAEDIRHGLPKSFLAQIQEFSICGAYGDPAVARDLIPIVSYLREGSPSGVILIFSNGGVRRPEWWAELARSMGSFGRVIFAIDGLEDTEGIYRRGVSFTKVMDNARAFIEAGGEAQWDFIAFRHNEHQVDAARALSEEIGFRKFFVKRTSRFLKSEYDYVPEQKASSATKFPIYSTNGRDIVGYLEPPRDEALVNDTVSQYERIVDMHGSLHSLFSATPINCRVLESKSIFVGAQGYVFPCCWTYVQATKPVLYKFPKGVDRQVYDLVQVTGGFDRINMRQVGLRGALESPFFAAVEASWLSNSIDAGRLKVCARVCGVNFPAYDQEFERSELVPG